MGFGPTEAESLQGIDLACRREPSFRHLPEAVCLKEIGRAREARRGDFRDAAPHGGEVALSPARAARRGLNN